MADADLNSGNDADIYVRYIVAHHRLGTGLCRGDGRIPCPRCGQGDQRIDETDRAALGMTVSANKPTPLGPPKRGKRGGPGRSSFTGGQADVRSVHRPPFAKQDRQVERFDVAIIAEVGGAGIGMNIRCT